MTLHAPTFRSGIGLACAAALTGCASSYAPDHGTLGLMSRGEYGRARFELAQEADTGDERDRLLRWEKAAIAALADGIPEAAEWRLDRIYDRLRTQGVNEGSGTGSIFVSEAGVRSWKGEPFEQAMMYAYIAVHDAQHRDWGNVRAAAGDSLFSLRDFSSGSGVVSPEELARQTKDAELDPDTLAQRVESNFVYGHLLAGFAAAQLGLSAEAEERYTAAAAIDPRVRTLADALRADQFDALLIVEYGLGPERFASGADGVQVSYRARTPSDDRALIVHDAAGESRLAQVADLNQMSRDHRWRSLDDIRRAKQAFGDALLIGGLAVATSGDDEVQVLAGLGAAAIGALAKSNSRADTRHNELLPQRVYLAPVWVGDDGAVSLEVEGGAGRLVLTGLDRRAPAGPSLRYVRLPGSAGAWATSGRVLYANDESGALAEPTLPVIFGGRDARTPSPSLLREWWAAGLPREIDDGDVEAAYRAEGIAILRGIERREARGHVLEGGSTLFTPLGGTAGFTRLYGEEHGTYRPKSPEARAIVDRIHEAVQHREGGAGTP